MKFGKIYTFENASEAKKLIGKKVYSSDNLRVITEEFESVSKDEVGVLQDVVTAAPFPFCVDGYYYQFVREFIEEEKEEPTLMTYRQLLEWLSKGNGERKLREDEPVSNALIYYEDDENLPVGEDVVIRPWDSDEWVKPTVEIYERYCKKRSEE